MRKIALALLAALSCSAASAQYISTTQVGEAYTWAGFTADGHDRMANDNRPTVIIYNDDFSVNHSFEAPVNPQSAVVSFGNYFVTQRLFNDDDLYEVVVQDIQDLAFYVYNENGEKLGTLPSDCHANIFPELITIGTEHYVYNHDYATDDVTYYAIEHRSDNLVSVRKVDGLKVFPNPVNPGETVRFQLPEGAISDVNLYNANGARELRMIGSEGTLELPASSLSSGVHPYTVTDSSGATHTGKLIVK